MPSNINSLRSVCVEQVGQNVSMGNVFVFILRLFFNETNLVALKRTVCFLKSPK